MIDAIISSQTRVALMRYFLTIQNQVMDYPRSLSRRLKISYMPIQKELKHLKEIGFLTEKKQLNTIVYKLNKEFLLYTELKKIFEKEIVDTQPNSKNFPKQICLVISHLKKVLPSKSQIFLFGSQATGTSKKNSDWDFGFQTDKKLALQKLLLLKSRVRDLAWPLRVDIVDFSRVTDDFKKLTLKQRIELQ